MSFSGGEDFSSKTLHKHVLYSVYAERLEDVFSSEISSVSVGFRCCCCCLQVNGLVLSDSIKETPGLTVYYILRQLRARQKALAKWTTSLIVYACWLVKEFCSLIVQCGVKCSGACALNSSWHCRAGLLIWLNWHVPKVHQVHRQSRQEREAALSKAS